MPNVGFPEAGPKAITMLESRRELVEADRYAALAVVYAKENDAYGVRSELI